MPDTFVQVAFPLPMRKNFTYRVPAELRPVAQVGCRVLAPFGARRLTGFIVGKSKTTDLDGVKEIQDVLDTEPVITPEILQLANWMCDYYLCSLGEALKATIPSRFLTGSRQVVRLSTEDPEAVAARLQTRAPRQAQILRYVAKCEKISTKELARRIGAHSLFSSLNDLASKGYVLVDQQLSRAAPKPKIEYLVRLTAAGQKQIADQLEELRRKAPKQAAYLAYLKVAHKPVPRLQLLRQTGGSLKSLTGLIQKGLVEVVERTVLRDYYSTDVVAEPQPVQLTAQQSDSVAQIRSPIRAHKFEAFLLFGVTGSGKTQIYIDAIHEVLAQGRSAIVLVPEISLTPQTVRRFRAHFRERVAVLHSAMSQGERYDSWRLLREGKASVAIGPRSAVFAPVQNLGLIVVDEEHEASYKQADSPRYHARDLAVVRAKMAQAVVILGSATPSAESFHNARTGKYRLLQLDKRVYDAPLPQVELVDMVKERRLSGTREELVFSRVLRQKIRERLEKEQQIILLLNRRGFSSFIKCKDCGYIAECENCNITLTYHLHHHRLRCHYCGYTRPAPERCPECSGADIVFRGFGTQKVEEELSAQFPEARVVRMDLDTTSQKRSHDRILRDFGRRRYDILLGTQMVAKGLDFERVTLVGVINADIGLLLPDFRSSERTFQLLTQVAGRAGRRNLPGEVIIQTYSQDSACLQCSRTHDFLRFFAGEIGERRALLYPPFGRLIAIFLRGKNEARVRQAAEHYAALLRKLQNGYLVLGPSPSPIARVQKYHRWQILLKGDKRKDRSGVTMRQSVQEADTLFREKFKSRGVQVAIDVDPVSLM